MKPDLPKRPSFESMSFEFDHGYLIESPLSIVLDCNKTFVIPQAVMQCEWRASKYQFSGNRSKDPYYFYIYGTKKVKGNGNGCPFRQALTSIHSFIK